MSGIEPLSHGWIGDWVVDGLNKIKIKIKAKLDKSLQSQEQHIQDNNGL